MSLAEPDPEGTASTEHGWRIGVDVGGTFTDLVLLDDAGAVWVCKVPSTPQDPGLGVVSVLEAASKNLGISVASLLGRCEIFVHGSTIATNTVIERKGACVGLITTEGFRDSLEIRRGIRTDPWTHREPYPEVLVPRYLRRPVRERIDRDGAEEIPLDERSVTAAAEVFRREGVESVAVVLINSFLDPSHERQVRDALRREWNLPWVSLSSEIAPVVGEYERSSTAVVNAYVAPRTVGYLRHLAGELAKRGLRQDMLLMQNNAGTATLAQLTSRPCTLLLSGPAAAVGALGYYSAIAGSDNLISMEIGGTSCDIAMMADGVVAITDALSIEGYDLALPSVDVHTLGAGGGTIAGIDGGGLLFAGPSGAGADPGPACYGRGGTEPTATDAQVVLGRLPSGDFAEGSVCIDSDLARAAILERIGRPLGLSAEEAASGVIRLLEQKLLQGVQLVTSERGHDPRRFTLVACGGSGPLHGAPVARRLGCERVFVPKHAGAFCAFGMLNSDLRHDYVRAHFAELDHVEIDALESIWDELQTEAASTLLQCGLSEEKFVFERAVDLRYRGQQWDVTVTIGQFSRPDARARFEREHERLFGHIQPDGAIEITKLRLSGIGRLARARPRIPTSAVPTSAQSSSRRNVWLDESHGWDSVAVYNHSDVHPGQSIAGPAIVEEATSTILVGRDDRLEVLPSGDYLIHVQ